MGEENSEAEETYNAFRLRNILRYIAGPTKNTGGNA
jgi:hypothetical protein